ncbi:YrzI family small protein [Bacillus manliponensis]|nr:YrzI family small protein [Bacillus manliponensis]
MIFQIFSFKITIQKDKLSKTNFAHKEHIQSMIDEVKEKQAPYCNHM